jgi:NADH dehydrogenase [ubiquinone] 1 alpha subcomplex assembly factor 6
MPCSVSSLDPRLFAPIQGTKGPVPVPFSLSGAGLSMPEPTLSYCAGEVRRHDPDRFLTALFAPADQREALFALYAFNHEIAKTRSVVTDPTLGLIRLQWWQDCLDEVRAGQVRRHAVVEPLAAAIRDHSLDVAFLERLIAAREADLDDNGHATLECLTAYAEVTSAPLVQLSLQILGAATADSLQAARHLGIAWALTGLIRAVPFHAAAGRVLLPRDLMAGQGLVEADLLAGRSSPGLAAICRQVAEQARSHLNQARQMRRTVPAGGRSGMLLAPLTDLYLDVLFREGFDPFAARVQMPHPFRQLKVGWAGLTGRW